MVAFLKGCGQNCSEDNPCGDIVRSLSFSLNHCCNRGRFQVFYGLANSESEGGVGGLLGVINLNGCGTVTANLNIPAGFAGNTMTISYLGLDEAYPHYGALVLALGAGGEIIKISSIQPGVFLSFSV